MRINGRNMLACKVLVQDFKGTITVEPMLGFKIIKDLVVDMEPFFEKYRSVMPYLITDDAPPEQERRQSQEDRTLRRHYQVYLVRGMYDVVSCILERYVVC